MSLAPVFHGRVVEGRLELVAQEKALRRVHLKRLEGQRVDVVVRRHNSKRSLAQNAYLHGVVCRILGEHFGYLAGEIKLILLGECFGWKTDPISGHELPVKLHTADLTVEEFSELVDWVIPWAMTEHGVSLPLPGEVAA